MYSELNAGIAKKKRSFFSAHEWYRNSGLLGSGDYEDRTGVWCSSDQNHSKLWKSGLCPCLSQVRGALPTGRCSPSLLYCSKENKLLYLEEQMVCTSRIQWNTQQSEEMARFNTAGQLQCLSWLSGQPTMSPRTLKRCNTEGGYHGHFWVCLCHDLIPKKQNEEAQT